MFGVMTDDFNGAQLIVGALAWAHKWLSKKLKKFAEILK